MPLPTPARSAQRYLGDARAKRVHDLLNEQPECEALEIIAAGKGERFIPDKVELALSLGYEACPHCLPEYAREEPDDQADAKSAAGADAEEQKAAEG